MKKRILSLFLALVTVFYILPIGSIPAIALDETEEESYLTIEDMEVGKLYKAEFAGDEFTPWARSPFVSTIDDEKGNIPLTLGTQILKVVRQSKEDFGLVYLCDDSIECLGEHTQYRYVDASKLYIFDGSESFTVDTMEIGKEYNATWATGDDGFAPYRKMDETEEHDFWTYNFVDSTTSEVLYTKDFPEELIVELTPYDEYFVYVTNDNWPEKYDQFRYIDAEMDLLITGEYNPTDDGYIYGKVDIFCEGAVDNVLRLERGKKVQAFTELGSGISANAKFQWEMEIEDGRWAIIPDSFMSYINVSEALIANTVGEYATLRCIVTDGASKYASEELKVQIKPDVNVYYGGANSAQQFAGGLSGVDTIDEDSTGNAFQADIFYRYIHATRPDKDGQNAAQPFNHTFHTSSDTLTATIYSPFVEGYTAVVPDPNGEIEYAGNKYTAKPMHQFNGVHMGSNTEDLVIVIYYIPNLVSFTVEYHEQSLADDSYIRAGQVRKDGYTDAYIGDDLAVPRVGFKALFYDKELTIAGNGDTIVEIYYDRIYYLVKFNLQGGYGITPYYVKYGAQVMLTEPTYPGYTFSDPWLLTRVYSVTEDNAGNKTETDIEITDELNSAYSGKDAGAIIVVRNNIEYTATWVVGSASYTIVYWRENADSTDAGNKANYSVWATETRTGAVPGSTVVCTGFDIPDNLATDEESYFTRAAALSDKEVVIKGDGSTAANIYYTRNTYHIWFKGVTGMCALYEHKHGTDCNLPLLCQLPVHQHSTETCGERVLICEATEHIVHNAVCCTRNEHTAHTGGVGGCCTKTEHTAHTGGDGGCCTKKEHTHTIYCYSFSSGRVSTTPERDNNWINAANNPNDEYNNGIVKARRKVGNKWQERYYYNVNGSWYQITGFNNDNQAKNATITNTGSCPGLDLQHIHGDGTCTCSTPLHTHGDGTCTCSTPLHTHGDGLCTCATPLHTHTDICYKYPNCEIVSSHAHTDACYGECDKYEHSHSEHNNTAGTDKYIYYISAKYNANIAELWPTADILDGLKITNGLTYNGKLYAWTGITGSPQASKIVNMTSDICDTNDGVKEGTADIEDITSYKEVYYLFESFDQTSPENGNVRRAYGNPSKYYDSDDDYYQKLYGIANGMGYKTIAGMKAASNDSQYTNNYVYLYYTRNRHNIVFNNVGTNVFTVNDVMYEYPISSLTYTANANVTIGKWSFKDKNGNTVELDIPIPKTPVTYEEGSVYFAGWYTTPMCADGTEYNFATATLPDENVYLYAKWQPTEYRVQVYRQESEIGSTITGQLLYDAVVPFDTQVREEHLAKYVIPQENYVFNGWYYVVGGEEKRYDFNTMLIKGETVIYGKWTKNIQIPYTIKYVIHGEGGEVIEIADREGGYSLAGIQKTFTAKMGEKLYDEYHEWYFPEQRYITHIMSENHDDNVIVFKYERQTTIEYNIVHNFKSEKLEQYGIPSGVFTYTLHESIEFGKTDFTTSITVVYDATVNETEVKAAIMSAGHDQAETDNIWKVITDLTADYFVQEMILTLEEENNIMTFNWTESKDTKTYHVIHYLQNKDKASYYILSAVNHTVQNDGEYDIIEEWDNPFGYVRKEVKISGVAKSEFLNQDQVNIKLGEFGEDATIEFFYDRELLDYTIHHYVNGTTQKIADDEHGQAYYEDEIKVSDVAKTLSGYVLANGTTVKEITVDDDEIICFYNPEVVHFLFLVAQPGRGTVSKPTYDGHVGEIPNQEEATVTATANEGFVFVGWYMDKEGVQSVLDYATVFGEGGKSITPNTPTEDMANRTIYFYALFEPTTRVFRNQGVVDENQSFIYRIRGLDTGNSNVDVTFVITGNSSVTLAMLPYGNYEITVLSWSWRYPLPNGKGASTWTENINSPNEYVFSYNTATAGPNNQWLSDDAQGGMAPTADSVS